MITKINIVVLYVADQERMLNFFVDQLGFEKSTDAEMAPGKRWLEVKPIGAESGLVLTKAADFGREPDTVYPLTFSCDDLDETVAQLNAHGLDVEEPIHEPWGSFIQITDPEDRSFIVASQTD